MPKAARARQSGRRGDGGRRPVLVSALTGEGVDTLDAAIETRLGATPHRARPDARSGRRRRRELAPPPHRSAGRNRSRADNDARCHRAGRPGKGRDGAGRSSAAPQGRRAKCRLLSRAALAASHSASISASVPRRGLAVRLEGTLDRGETRSRTCRWCTQRRLGVEVEMPARLTTANNRSPISSATLPLADASDRGLDLVGLFVDLGEHRARRSSRSRPCRPSPGASARGSRRAGRPARRRERLASCIEPPAARASAFSAALIRSHRPFDLFRRRAPPSPNTCGWRRISFSVIAWTTSPKSKAPCSSAMRAWNTTCSRRSPSSSRRSASRRARSRRRPRRPPRSCRARWSRILLEIPRTAAAGRAQRRHDLDQPGDVAGRFQRSPGWQDASRGSRDRLRRIA